MAPSPAAPSPTRESGVCRIRFEDRGPRLILHLEGAWRLCDGLPSVEEIARHLQGRPTAASICFEAKAVSQWDTGLLTFLLKLGHWCEARGIDVDWSGLPEGARRLRALATAVPERLDARRSATTFGPLTRLGHRTVGQLQGTRALLNFTGEVTLALGALIRGKARFRAVDLWLNLYQCGPQALPIVTLISFLVGIILAFVGAVQLAYFGAQIYVASLVGLTMAREMAAMMTAIIMAGRTGAAFAAQLGTMRVKEEIDALTTLGISPVEFLVLPRMLALVIMLPLLTLYANLMGMLGGAAVAQYMLDFSFTEYYVQTQQGLRLVDFLLGLIKSVVYGVLVALAGCLRGMECGNSAQAVGQAATAAVVTAIVWIVVASALLTILYNILGY
ncbi:MAG: MlaE family ABC transporter permease [Candidatus Competibacterales bacterium]